MALSVYDIFFKFNFRSPFSENTGKCAVKNNIVFMINLMVFNNIIDNFEAY